MTTSSGYNLDEAVELIEITHRDSPGPYTLIGYSEPGNPKKVKNRPNILDAPLRENVYAIYAEFRQFLPSGRFFMIIGAKFDPKTWDYDKAIFLDTNIVEKAIESKKTKTM